jgi:FKBP-type peptidyl-prolyl cis-trans isomerase
MIVHFKAVSVKWRRQKPQAPGGVFTHGIKRYTVKMKIKILPAIAALVLMGCADGVAAPFTGEEENAIAFSTDGSYALGMDAGNSFKTGGLLPDTGEFISGMQDSLKGEPKFTTEEAGVIFNEAYSAFIENQTLEGGGTSAFAFGSDASYVLGMDTGNNLKTGGLLPDINEFTNGMQDALNGQTRISTEDAGLVFNEAYSAFMEERNKAGAAFLERNAQKPGITVTQSGLQYQVLSEPGLFVRLFGGANSRKPTASDTVKVHYDGMLTNGTVFDSSRERGEPTEFPLSGVIPGWTEGMQLMSVGSSYRFFVPPELGYGANGAPPQIPPYSVLVFDVELIEVMDGSQ